MVSLLRRTAPALVALWIAAAALVLLVPALNAGWVADDYLHQLLQRDEPGIPGLEHRPFDLFRFAQGDPERSRTLIEQGVFPWWADPHARVAFFRPLASWTHWIDHQLWPQRAALMHAHSLAWYAGVLLVVGCIYRTLVRGRAGFLLAFALFAFNDAHAPVVGWIANRNALISTAFGGLALLAYHRHRIEGCRWGAWLGPVGFSLGLLAGESAVTVGSYLVAHAVFLGGGRPMQRFQSLLPYASALLWWKIACVTLGYGVSGSGVYVDPVTSPLTFAAAAFERFPVLFLALFAEPFADLWEVYPLVAPALRPLVSVAGWIAVALLAWVLRAPLRGDRRLRFWALGSLLSLLLSCATFPHDRMLLVPNLGGMVLVASLIVTGFRRGARRSARAGASGLAIVHLVAAPLLLSWRASKVGDFDQIVRASDSTLPSAAQLRDRTVVLVNPPIDPFAAYLPLVRQTLGEVRPALQLWLADGHSEVTLCGLDEHRVAVRPSRGYLATASELMLRSRKSPLALGDRVELDSVQFTVAELTSDDRPASVNVRFERPVADHQYVWMRWDGRGYTRFSPPAAGSCTRFAAVDLGALLLGT